MTILTRPSRGFASTLPGYYYTDAAIYALEQERIFGQMWVCASPIDAIPQAGDYIVVMVGHESVILLRDRQGDLRAYFNVCRHRGTRICTEARGHITGALQCPYHFWSYGLDGKLIGAPAVYSTEGFDPEGFGLIPVASAVRDGLIWLNISEDPKPLDEQYLPWILDRFSDLAQYQRYGLENLKIARTIDYDVRCNWKLIVENFQECYHCGPTHPELCRLLPQYKQGGSYTPGVGKGTMLANDVEAFSVSGKANYPRLPGLLPEDDRAYFGFIILPNAMINLFHDHALVQIVIPLGVDRTLVHCDWLFHPEAMAQPGFDPSEAVDIFDLVNRQDWRLGELTQQGMSSRAYRDGGIYIPIESDLKRFVEIIQEKLGHSAR